MGQLINILQEIQIRSKLHLVKGKVYDITKKNQFQSIDNTIIKNNMEYSGVNVNGDHLFFNHMATSRVNMNWLYIKEDELNNYIFKLNKIHN